jgi:hypothetical protein
MLDGCEGIALALVVACYSTQFSVPTQRLVFARRLGEYIVYGGSLALIVSQRKARAEGKET